MWGQERARQGDYEGAVSAWSQALAINPQDLVVRQNLAVALERAGRSEEAIPHWHELVRQMPREVGGAARRKGEAEEDSLRNHVRAVAHRHLADLYLDQEEVERAIDQLEKAVKARRLEKALGREISPEVLEAVRLRVRAGPGRS